MKKSKCWVNILSLERDPIFNYEEKKSKCNRCNTFAFLRVKFMTVVHTLLSGWVGEGVVGTI